MKTTTRPSLQRARSFSAALLSFGYLSLAMAPAYASDTEVYSQTANANAGAAPTVMLDLDSSSNMELCLNSTATCSAPNRRVDALKRAMRKVLTGDNSVTPAILPAPGHVRMGLSLVRDATNTASGTAVRHPVRRLDDVVTSSSATTGGGNLVTAGLANGNQDAHQLQSTGAMVTNAATLYLAVDASSNNLYTGLQFPKVSVPKGATIIEAYLQFTSKTTADEDARWNLAIQDSDDAAADFATTGMRDSDRTYYTTASYQDYLPEDWVAESQYQVPVTGLVQHVVDRAGWCGNKAMSFRIEDLPAGGGRRREAYSFEGTTDPAKRPQLVVRYGLTAANAASSCIWQDISTTYPVVSSLDDVDWDASATSGTGIKSNNTALAPWTITSTVKKQVGVRFKDIPVENNSSGTTVFIDTATLNLTADGTANNQTNLEVAAYQSNSLAAFCTAATTCTLPTDTLSAATTWAITGLSKNVRYSLNVKPMVDAIFSRAGWARGNALGFRIQNATTTSKNGSVYAFDGSASSAPSLTLTGRQRITSLTPINILTTTITTTKTVREELLETIDLLEPSANAPVAAGYIEASRYMLGLAKQSNKSHTSTYSGTNYISPITAATQCSGTYMYLLTGGDPASASGVQSNAQDVAGADACNFSNEDVAGTGSTNKLTWKCMYGTGKHLASLSNQKATRVRTNTMALGDLGSYGDDLGIIDNMKKVADYGDGKAYTGQSEADLIASLQETIKGALDEGATISAPGVAVNQLSRLTHLDQLFYSVFDPDNQALWRGNVKRYRLGFAGTTPTVFDAANNPAIDSSTSFFKDTAKSWWGPTDRDADGRVARAGGAAKVLPYPEVALETSDFVLNGETMQRRRMYTHLSSYPTLPSSSTVDLTAVEPDDATFTAAAMPAMGVADTNTYKRLMYWLLGYDVAVYKDGLLNTDPITIDPDTDSDGQPDEDTPLRREMGGALHSRPVLVNYGYQGSDINAALTNANLQDNTVYFSTLEGVLHAVDTNTGVEEFSFMPKEKLSTVEDLAGTASRVEPEYGLDLTWTVLREDKNGDFKITATDSSGAATGDKVWIYGGMRMGGRNIYALDVTDRSTPKLKWVIEGGAGVFANIGQTWSQPALGQVKINGVLKTVLFFAGGYDPNHESTTYLPANDSVGNQVYIVDATTGEVYWWASSTNAGVTAPSVTVSDMKFSIPSDIKPFDSNGDGLVDALYFGDTGGQVFRIDLNNATTTASGLGARVQLLAKLGQTAVTGATVVNQRRFFEAPSVARFEDASGQHVLVGIGSGYRSHPLVGAAATDNALNVTNDFFYMLRDNDVLRSDIPVAVASSLQAVILPADLATVANPGTVTATGVSTTGLMGWKADLPDLGEKVLASPIIFNNKVFFTTYVPTVVNPNPCLPIYGRTKLYEVGAANASLQDTNNDGTIDSNDRSLTDNVVFGLGGEAQLIVLPPSSLPEGLGGCGTIVLVGTNASCGDNRTTTSFKRLRWYNKTKN